MKKLFFSLLFCGFAIIANAQFARQIDFAADSIYTPDSISSNYPSSWFFTFQSFGQDSVKPGDTLAFNININGQYLPGPSIIEHYEIVINKAMDIGDTIGFNFTLPGYPFTTIGNVSACVLGFLQNRGNDSITNETGSFFNNQKCRTIYVQGNLSAKETLSLSSFAMFPNPAGNDISFSYNLTSTSLVNVRIMDLSGKAVAVPVNETQAAGDHSFSFDISTLSPGIYMTHIQLGETVKTEKLIINR